MVEEVFVVVLLWLEEGCAAVRACVSARVAETGKAALAYEVGAGKAERVFVRGPANHAFFFGLAFGEA